jgi:hypothetical protein
MSNDYWQKIAEAHGCDNLTDAFVQLTNMRESLKELFAADEEYGTGFYQTDRWRSAYDKLREMTLPK